MKRRVVRATIADEAIYAEVEGHVDAELYEIARRDGGPIAMRVTRVFALHVEGMGGYWIDEDGVEGDLEAYLRDRWLSGADQPMVMPEELEDTGEEFMTPPPDQPPLLPA